MLGLSHPLSSRMSLASVVPTAPKRHPTNGAESFGIKDLTIESAGLGESQYNRRAEL